MHGSSKPNPSIPVANNSPESQDRSRSDSSVESVESVVSHVDDDRLTVEQAIQAGA